MYNIYKYRYMCILEFTLCVFIVQIIERYCNNIRDEYENNMQFEIQKFWNTSTTYIFIMSMY